MYIFVLLKQLLTFSYVDGYYVFDILTRGRGDHFKVVGLKIWRRHTSNWGNCPAIYHTFAYLDTTM